MADEDRTLRGAQATIRDAFRSHETGLFCLDCNAGAGKTYALTRIVAEWLAERRAAGVRAPERRLCFVSFSRADAADIAPEVDAALRELSAREDVESPVADETAASLGRRVRHAPHVGTVDSVLRSVFERIRAEVGFDERPAVGAAAALDDVHESCLDVLRDDSRYDRLAAAYGDDRDDETVGDLLRSVHRAARERRLSPEAAADRLRETVADTYPDGPPEDFAAVLDDVRALVDDETAERTAEAFSSEDRETFLRADAACYEAWLDAIDDLRGLVRAYTTRYDELTRDRGVVDHLDVAHWVAEFFSDSTFESDFRATLRTEYAHRFSTVVLDEAQDVSTVQHDALAALVPSDARVLVAGDVKQCIYGWRSAQPSLFRRAIDEGRYLGVGWETHEVARAATNYRSRPAITAAVDAVFEPAFDDDTRAGVGSLNVDYALHDADREGTDDPAVHVAPYDTPALPRPGSGDSIDGSEADELASYVARGLANGTFSTGADRAEITVLFPRRTHMATFAARFEEWGLTVANASTPLFDDPQVRLVAAVVRWLTDPFDPARTRLLLAREVAPLVGTTVDDESTVSRSAGSPASLVDDCVADVFGGNPPDGVGTIRDGLRALAARRDRHLVASEATVVGDVVDRLELRRDPLGVTDDPRQRSANLDALVAHVDDAHSSGERGLDALADALDRVRESPSDGPHQPVPPSSDHDVVFRTIHQMKGDESDVVVLADLTQHLATWGPHASTVVARGDELALAPPGGGPWETTPPIPGFEAGVFASAADGGGPGSEQRDRGLRWATEHWVGPDEDELAGPAALRTVAGDRRAERWRLLYVAMTRARDHLVVPLPERGLKSAREYWAKKLADALVPDDVPSAETVSRSAPSPDGGSRPFDVSVGNVGFGRPSRDRNAPVPAAATVPEEWATGWTPRQVNASTLAPLLADPDEHLIAHLQGRALHADPNEVPSDLPLSFETTSPDLVGVVTHEVFTAAIRRAVATDALANCDGAVARALDDALAREAASVDPAERDGVRRYVAETLCPQLAETAAWQRANSRDDVAVEVPVAAVVDVGDGLRVETKNRVDVLSRTSNGDWHVDELKVRLAPVDDETRARSVTQAAVYASLLRQQFDEVVSATVTHVGVECGSCDATDEVDEVPRQFERLRGLLDETGQ
ncbi:UvrD-helicase domain-containing protein [Haloarculaceae archaeon H-GB2-1]|nr:UvrD-helicase domain-containing protein [Haloarculaceae archaeon H-GB1-1]MEA5410010.1 UvrD-helicase domain-containing protein [Haloarculaceae archaeon H-GB2-1]